MPNQTVALSGTVHQTLATTAINLERLMIDEWTVGEFDDRPLLGPDCPGIDTHPWRLSVQEGRVVLESGCESCDEAVMGPVGGEDVNMDINIVGRLKSHLEMYRTCDSTEYDHWWVFVPERIEPEAGGSFG